jgi:hypothetical protein
MIIACAMTACPAAVGWIPSQNKDVAGLQTLAIAPHASVALVRLKLAGLATIAFCSE